MPPPLFKELNWLSQMFSLPLNDCLLQDFPHLDSLGFNCLRRGKYSHKSPFFLRRIDKLVSCGQFLCDSHLSHWSDQIFLLLGIHPHLSSEAFSLNTIALAGSYTLTVSLSGPAMSEFVKVVEGPLTFDVTSLTAEPPLPVPSGARFNRDTSIISLTFSSATNMGKIPPASFLASHSFRLPMVPRHSVNGSRRLFAPSLLQVLSVQQSFLAQRLLLDLEIYLYPRTPVCWCFHRRSARLECRRVLVPAKIS
jgi:hypothetical protein